MWDKDFNRLPKEYQEDHRWIGLNLHTLNIQFTEPNNILEILKELFDGDNFSYGRSGRRDIREMSLSYDYLNKQSSTKSLRSLCQESTTGQLQLEALSLRGFALDGLFNSLAQNLHFSRLRDFTFVKCAYAEYPGRELGLALKGLDAPLRHVQVDIEDSDSLTNLLDSPDIITTDLSLDVYDNDATSLESIRDMAPRLRSLGLHHRCGRRSSRRGLDSHL